MSANKPGAASIAPIEVVVESGKVYWWCACGLSRKQPFCDGSHKGTLFTPVRYAATETGTKWFCVCKRTQNRPLCDGAGHLCTGANQQDETNIVSKGEVPADEGSSLDL
jgi:CDGSH iron-sulfur domain-containing protein 3